jgi:radical SAM protein with 4Fe4S-binding SPASM domain
MANIELDKPHMGEFKRASEHSAFKCISGKCGFWLTWDGRLTPCGLLNEPYSEPLEIGFGNAWRLLRKSCKSIPACEECLNCSYRSKCMTCPARLKTETGSFTKPAEYLCEMAKGRAALGIKY